MTVNDGKMPNFLRERLSPAIASPQNAYTQSNFNMVQSPRVMKQPEFQSTSSNLVQK